jgi:hypothetical protein
MPQFFRGFHHLQPQTLIPGNDNIGFSDLSKKRKKERKEVLI